MIIPLDIPDQYVQPLVDAIAAKFGWTEASGLTKSDFAINWLYDSLLDIYVGIKSEEAANTARVAKIAEIRNNVVLPKKQPNATGQTKR